MSRLITDSTLSLIDKLGAALAETKASLEHVQREDFARSDAFHGLTQDVRCIAAEIFRSVSADGTYIHSEVTPQKLRQWAAKLEEICKGRFEEWMERRDSRRSRKGEKRDDGRTDPGRANGAGP